MKIDAPKAWGYVDDGGFLCGVADSTKYGKPVAKDSAFVAVGFAPAQVRIIRESDWRYIKKMLDAAVECACAGGNCGDRRCKTAEALREHLAKREAGRD